MEKQATPEQAVENINELKSKRSLGKIVSFIVLALISFIVAFGATFFIVYRQDIRYSASGEAQDFEVKSGEGIESIGRRLEDASLVRNWKSFRLYTILNGQTNIKIGHYLLSPKMTIPEIVSTLNEGRSQVISLTFLPGGTVQMAKNVLVEAGFDESEINLALDKDYTAEFPNLFIDKSAEADLEGYIYGETYNFEKGVKVEDILRRAFKEMQDVVVKENLKDKYAEQGLNLYQGIILASIVQKEEPHIENQKAVARVFYNRLSQGMNLGSDPTYEYAAVKLGLANPRAQYHLDSPYNTRIHSGLTPTPIAAPGAAALQAVAEPDDNDYLFFLSGDDDKLYFATTDAEHQQNTFQYCQKKCFAL